MKKILVLIATVSLGLAVSCNCKKEEDPKPETKTTSAAVNYRIEADDDIDDAPASVSVQKDAAGNAFLVIKYNPKYIKQTPGYPVYTTTPIIGYPAFANAYALQDGVVSDACLSQALVLVSKASTYLSSPNGLCDYISELKKTLEACSGASAQIKPAIDMLSAVSACK